MCRNHSHITTENTGLLLVGETRLMEMRVIHPLAVELPYGEVWTKPAGATLYLPVSMSEPLPALHRRQMEVCYTPSFYTGSYGTITTPEHPPRPMPVGESGAMSCVDGVPLPPLEMTSDDDIPW